MGSEDNAVVTVDQALTEATSAAIAAQQMVHLSVRVISDLPVFSEFLLEGVAGIYGASIHPSLKPLHALSGRPVREGVGANASSRHSL